MYRRGRLALVLLLSLLIVACGSVGAATITGRVTLPDGRPLLERFVYCNATYGGTAHAYDYLELGDNGYYTLENLPLGTYSLAVVDPWFVRAQIVTNVEVTSASGTYTVDIPLRSTYYSPDDNWPTDPRWRWVPEDMRGSDYAQSFVATGPYVVRATIRNCEWGANKEIEVSVHEGGPAGQQIGPARVVRSGAGHGETAWAGDEVPVTPGATYWLRARSTNGSNWAPGLGCVAYPQGDLYIDGDIQPGFDMTWSISCDDDGYVSSYYIARHKSYDEPGVDANEWGQTFVARSVDIQLASAHMFSPGTCDLDFSIHEGGPGGRQIGPTRTARIEQEVGRDQTGAVLWGPGEVPVTPGETYYLAVRRHGGGLIRLSRWRERYPLGSAYHDGVKEDDWDLESQILGAEPEVGVGRYVLAWWREKGYYENCGGGCQVIHVYVFDETGDPMGNVPVYTSWGTWQGNTDPTGWIQIVIYPDEDRDARIGQPGVLDSAVTPLMSTAKWPQYGHYSFDCGFMYKSDAGDPGEFDTAINCTVNPRGSTETDIPYTESLIYYSAICEDWLSDEFWYWTSGGVFAQMFVVPPGINRIVGVRPLCAIGGVSQLQFTAEIREGSPTGPLVYSKTSSLIWPFPNWQWLPFGAQACPVAPGQTYCLVLRRYPTGSLNAAYCGDVYCSGYSYQNGVPFRSRDLLGYIVGMSYGAPTCDITYAPSSPTTDDIIAFDSAAADPDGTVISVDWDFGDGSTAGGDPAAHQYAMPGTYAVTVVVCDSEGLCATCTAQVTVAKGANIPPVCGVTYEPADPAPDEEIILDANAYDPNPWGVVVSYQWDFGDGHMGTGDPATHAYADWGTYTVCVTITDDQGGQTTCCAQLAVIPPCSCDLIIDRTHCKMPAAGHIGQCKTGQIGARNSSFSGPCAALMRVVDNAGNVVFETVETIGPGRRLRVRFDHCYTAEEVGRNVWSWEVWPADCRELTPWNNVRKRKVNVHP